METSAKPDQNECENETFDSESYLEVNYLFNERCDPCLTHSDTSQFKTNDCYTKGCKWSVYLPSYVVYVDVFYSSLTFFCGFRAPDGLCFLTNSNDNILRVWDVPECLNNVTEWQSNSDVAPISPSLYMKEGGLIYDFCWYPLMNSWNPVTCW